MPRFQDDQQVYAMLGGMFEDVLADTSGARALRRVGGTVQWQLRRPNARITVRLAEGEDPGVDYGDTDARPEVVLSMDAETAHRFWAGELPLNVALSKGLIRAKGPVATILRIVPVVEPARALYAARLAGGGAPVAPPAQEPAQAQDVVEAAAPEAEVTAAVDPEEATAVVEAEPPAEADTSAEEVAQVGEPAVEPSEPDSPEAAAEPEPDPPAAA